MKAKRRDGESEQRSDSRAIFQVRVNQVLRLVESRTNSKSQACSWLVLEEWAVLDKTSSVPAPV
jgi:hypothetical protein